MNPPGDITNRPDSSREDGRSPPKKTDRSPPQPPKKSRPSTKPWPANIDIGRSLDYAKNGGIDMTDDDCMMIARLFRGTTKVGSSAFGLTVCVTELPPRPHPVAIGDVPLYLTTDEKDLGWGNLVLSHGGTGSHALREFDWSESFEFNEGMCDKIAEFCVSQRIPLTAVRHLFTRTFMCMLSRPHNVKHLPKTFGGVVCFWRQGKPRSEYWAATRQIDPVPNRPDDTNYYPNLRPGVIISSRNEDVGDHPGFVATMGIGLERISDGKRLVTVPEHAFFEHGEVYHAHGSSARHIGKVVGALADTDIALMELDSDVTHSNEVFACDGKSLKLTEIALNQTKSTLVEKNSPFDGLVSGQIVMDELRMVPSVEELDFGKKWAWAQIWWASFSGDEADFPTNRTCGTPVIKQDTGVVVGFFRYHDVATHLSEVVGATNIELYWPGQYKVASS